jgi:hypothetical protein
MDTTEFVAWFFILFILSAHAAIIGANYVRIKVEERNQPEVAITANGTFGFQKELVLDVVLLVPSIRKVFLQNE